MNKTKQAGCAPAASAAPQTSHFPSRGFSLLELLVVLAILGVLAAIALPTYRDSVLKTNRADARITLSSLATQQEKHFFRSNQYSGDFADLLTGVSSGASIDSQGGYYAISLNGGGSTWSMTATAQGEQAEDTECATLSLDHLGRKSATDAEGNASEVCW